MELENANFENRFVFSLFWLNPNFGTKNKIEIIRSKRNIIAKSVWLLHINSWPVGVIARY
jgi:hypothetical protein